MQVVTRLIQCMTAEIGSNIDKGNAGWTDPADKANVWSAGFLLFDKTWQILYHRNKNDNVRQ